MRQDGRRVKSGRVGWHSAAVIKLLAVIHRAGGGEVAYRDLRDFLKRLEKEGELKRITAEVDPVLEITEINDRVGESGRAGAAV